MLYNETNADRRAEYIECLEHNLKHPLIKGIHVLYDTSKDDSKNILFHFILKKNISFTPIHGRATFQQCFDIANTVYKDNAIILCNGDIYFNETLHALRGYCLEGKFLALSRWDVQKNGSLKIQLGSNSKPLYCSQDAWIFKSPITTIKANIMLGLLGCDGTIAKNALQAGFIVTNPCLTIQCCHLHLTNIHHYPSTFAYPSSGYYDVIWTHLDKS